MDPKKLEALLETKVPLTELDPFVKMLIYGDYGVGKTILACQYGDNILYIDSATGWVSFRTIKRLWIRTLSEWPIKGCHN